MNIINIEQISKLYGEKKVLDEVSVGIDEGDKIGIVGINGMGKSTLLKILVGEEESDSGQVIMQNNLHISYLPQNPEYDPEVSVLDFVMDNHLTDLWNLENDAKNTLTKLGITDFSQKMGILSGGQRKRAALAKTILSPSDVMVLDEPTNHLDHEMVAWLEDYLFRFRGTIIMVTHDRYFLDKVTNRIFEIHRGNLYSYYSNYSGFLEQKAAREEMALASERKRQSILRMEIEWAKRGCRARTTKQKARLERLELLKAGKAPEQMQNVMLDSVETRMGKKTIELHQISKQYEDRSLISDFEYIFLKKQRLGIIGGNGCGKSTLIKLIAGLVEPDSGYVEVGETIRIGYFSQEEEDMDTSDRVIDYIKEVGEYITTTDGKITASQMLERFLFDGAMQYTPVNKLSGGEKRRLYLLKVLMSAPNVLLLDEPTNNLDIPTLTILEDYLESFSGIIVTVSHDRYFLDAVVDRILCFENGEIRQYDGDYTDYHEKAKQHAVMNEVKAAPQQDSGSNKKDWKSNRQVKLKFTFKEKQEYDTIDDDIAKLEEKIEQYEKDMMKNATNSGKLAEIMREKTKAEQELEEKMDRWVYLNDLAEKIAAQ